MPLLFFVSPILSIQQSPDAILLRGGRIIDPVDHFDEVGDVLVQDGKIVARGGSVGGIPADVRVVNAEAQIVCPGFVDIHTHLRFPGLPEKETMESGTAAAAAGGFTTICGMANTSPVVDNTAILEDVLREARRVDGVHVRQLAAVTPGLAGERLTDMRALAAAGAVAFSDDGKPVRNADIMRQALSLSAELGKAISAHEEDPALVGDGVANAGEIARRLSLAEWPCAGETSMVERDVALLEQVGGHLHIAHLSCAGTVGPVRRAQVRGLRVTAEVTPHHLRLSERLLEGEPGWGLPSSHPNTKVNPPLRSPGDVEAVVEALADGTIAAIATDHAPHSTADKTGPYERSAFGFSGLETALPLTLELVRERYLDVPTLIERLTVGPSRVFGLDAGTLLPGAAADVCVFDPAAIWVVTADSLRSTGKNTPLLGATLTGRVTWTIAGGKISHRPDHEGD